MAPVMIINAIGALTKEIYNSVQRVEANKNQCERIYHRIESISNILSALKTLRNDEQFVAHLNDLHICMQQCYSFIMQFQDKSSWIMKVVKSGTHEKEFAQLNQALTDKISVLELSINVQQLFDHSQDVEDRRLDLAWIESHQQEIMAGQAQILAAVQDIKVNQKNDLEEIKNRLLSLKLHVQNREQASTLIPQATQHLTVASYQPNTRSLASNISIPYDEVAAKQNYSQGQAFEKEGNENAAAKAYQTAAEAGYYRAKTNLGLYYLLGKGGLPINKKEAHKLFLEAANEGHTRAMCNLFSMLWHGDGVPEDHDSAKKWLTEAANKEDNWAIQKCSELGFKLSAVTLKN
ncbi:MAG: hypothetical protein ABSF18_00690 [Gammaproteobacteria bacterium]|jgi:hypothetical protein